MNPEDLLRMIDVIHRDKDIPKEVIFRGLEEALAAGVRKRLGVGEDLVVHIDRKTCEIKMEDAEGITVWRWSAEEDRRVAAYLPSAAEDLAAPFELDAVVPVGVYTVFIRERTDRLVRIRTLVSARSDSQVSVE